MKTQKELKAQYLKELELNSTWAKEPTMITYCYNKASVIVELKDWWLYVIEKPSIQKDFCFWYYTDSDGSDYQRANEMAKYASKEVSYFLERNLRDIDDYIERLQDILEKWYDDMDKDVAVYKHHWNWDSEDCLIREICFLRDIDIDFEKRRQEIEKADKEDVETILNWYIKARELFKKRLQTYLKKYWLTQVNTWSYRADA